MTNLPPVYRAKQPISAVRGKVVDAVAIGWRGDRVHIRWKPDLGNHIGWVDAADVKRV